jgi:ATP synthase protein I
LGFGMRAGAQFVGSAVGGGAIGWLIDRWLGTSPFGLLIVMILFFGAALVNVWLMMSRAVEDVTARIASGELPATEETKKDTTGTADGESA